MIQTNPDLPQGVYFGLNSLRKEPIRDSRIDFIHCNLIFISVLRFVIWDLYVVISAGADSKYFVVDLVQLKLGVIAEHLLETSYPFCKLPGGNPGIAMSFKFY